MYYHIKLLIDNSRGETRINLSKEELIERYVDPYLKGDPILINGRTLDPYKLYRVKITCSETSLDKTIEQIKKDDALDRSPYSILRAGAEWRALDTANDITEQYINKAPGSIKNIAKIQNKNSSNQLQKDTLFSESSSQSDPLYDFKDSYDLDYYFNASHIANQDLVFDTFNFFKKDEGKFFLNLQIF